MANTFAAAVEAHPGGLTSIAAELGESVQVVSNWKSRGVPPNRCKAVEKLLGISVTLLRPDDWRDYWPDADATTPGVLGEAAVQGG